MTKSKPTATGPMSTQSLQIPAIVLALLWVPTVDDHRPPYRENELKGSTRPRSRCNRNPPAQEATRRSKSFHQIFDSRSRVSFDASGRSAIDANDAINGLAIPPSFLGTGF
jgi:hypothetical protein